MHASSYRALVVDDEAAIREATSRALLEEGFTCQQACDGEAALERLEKFSYDVIITDLKMPGMNGHALAVQVLGRAQNRPLLIIQTGIIEPRLARDLFARGVDDIVYKPCDQRLLAMKIKRMVESHRERTDDDEDRPRARETRKATDRSVQRLEITTQDIDRKLGSVSRVLPVSQAAIEVFAIVSTDSASAQQIAAAIQRDPVLALEVLKIANTTYFNPAGKKISKLEDAVTRIGHRRIAELAIATNALTAMTKMALRWLDVDLTWRRCLAAGVAMELLIEHGGHGRIEEGLVLCALLHPMGRVVLGSLYPNLYPALIEACRNEKTSLSQEEGSALPCHHAKVLSKLLKTWQIPLDVYLPLTFLYDDWRAVARLGEPMRTRVELLRCASIIGRIAVGRWVDWDTVDSPSPKVLERINIHSLAPLIAKTRERTRQLLHFRESPNRASDCGDLADPPEAVELTYLSYTEEAFDLVPFLLSSVRVRPVRVPFSSTCAPDILSCHSLSETDEARLSDVEKCGVLILKDGQEWASRYDTDSHISLPCSHAEFARVVLGTRAKNRAILATVR